MAHSSIVNQMEPISASLYNPFWKLGSQGPLWSWLEANGWNCSLDREFDRYSDKLTRSNKAIMRRVNMARK